LEIFAFVLKNTKLVKELGKFDGVIVPGGFGTRGVEGIIKAIQYVRENNIPYLGLCYGMQLAMIEIARHAAKLKNSNTVEMNAKVEHPIIHVNPFQKQNISEKKYGGTMRLGAYNCQITPGTKAAAAYKAKNISERHRHRYEFNNAYREQLEAVGVVFSGINPEQDLVEIAELKNHPWFVGTQFHPEFKSRPLDPHPLHLAFIKACIKKSTKKSPR
jgi:CTP synthase